MWDYGIITHKTTGSVEAYCKDLEPGEGDENQTNTNGKRTEDLLDGRGARAWPWFLLYLDRAIPIQWDVPRENKQRNWLGGSKGTGPFLGHLKGLRGNVRHCINVRGGSVYPRTTSA